MDSYVVLLNCSSLLKLSKNIPQRNWNQNSQNQDPWNQHQFGPETIEHDHKYPWQSHASFQIVVCKALYQGSWKVVCKQGQISDQAKFVENNLWSNLFY